MRQLLLVVLFSLLGTGCAVIPKVSSLPAGTFTLEVTSAPTFESIETVIPFDTTESLDFLPESLVTNEVDGAALVFIEKGEFLMGAEPEQGLKICEQSRGGCQLEDFVDEAPVHQVYLSGFWIYKTEVTNLQYSKCQEEGMCPSPEFLEFYTDPQFGNHPVVFVNWFAADGYCNWAGGRLPTEAEWEKASRGTSESIFPWGNEIECGFANIKGCTQGLTMAVGSYPEGASIFGVLDMAGNVTEWVSDWYQSDYYNNSPFVSPLGPSDGELKVARGGSWKNPISGVRTTNRTANFPNISSSGTGFRCVLSSVPNP